MSDALEIASMFQSTNRVDEPSFTKEEYVEVFDLANGNYATGQVPFITDAQMKHHVVYSDSYLSLPVSCEKSTDGRVAVKNSILSFIQGLEVQSGSGTALVNEQLSTPIIANLRLILDSSLDFREANELIYCGPDKTIDRNVSGDDTSIVGSVLPSASSGLGLVADSLNFLKNPALQNRITVLSSRSTFVAAAGAVPAMQQFVAIIPLRFIHDLFRAMDFPMINLSLRITFNIAGAGSYTGFSPWTTPVYPAHSTLGSLAAPVDAPVAAGVADTTAPAVASPVVSGTTVLSSYTDRFGGKYAPRLFLKTVYFTKDVAEQMKAKIVAGFSKQLSYTVSNYYNQAVLAGAASQGVNWPFAQGIIRPTRMWVFPLAAGTLKDTTNTFPARTGSIALKNMNIQLNGDNFYNKQFQTQYEFYRELKRQMITAGSSQSAATPLSYSDFISGSAYYCFDLSRNLTVQTNNLCTMALQSDLVDQATGAAPAGAIDLYVLVERVQTVTFKVSEGGIEVLVKQGTLE